MPGHLRDAAAGADPALELVAGPRGLALRRAGGPSVSARVDLLTAGRRAGADQLLRAVLAGKTDVIDATAGLGADAFHLAAKGVTVTMIERAPLVAALLEDALARAAAGEYGAAALAASARLSLYQGDASRLLTKLSAGVVLLDPMFPSQEKGAAPNKGMSLLRELLPSPAAADLEVEHRALLAAAQRAARRRVVVKRSLRAEPLAGTQPSGSLVGRTVRFDLYAPVPPATAAEQGEHA